MRNLENLSSDILDNDFSRCFWPMYMIQMILGCARVDITGGYVTPATNCQKIYTVMWFLASTGSAYHLINHFHITYYHENVVLYYLIITAAYLQYVTSMLNLIHVRFFNGDENAELYVILQKIDRSIGLDYIKTINRNFFKFNLLYAFLVTFLYLGVVLVIIYIRMRHPMFTIFLGFSIVSTYMEIALQESLTYFIGTRLRCVNEILKAHLVGNRRCQCSESHYNKEIHNILCDGDDYLIAPEVEACFTYSVPSESTVVSLKFILKAFKIVVTIFSFQVILMVANICIWILLIIDTLIIGERSKFVPLKGTASLSMWIILNFIHMTAQSVVVEWFLTHARTTKRLCIRILSLYSEGPLRVSAKRLLLALEGEGPRFSVYGMFALDRHLPLKLIGLITTYVLLLMQFTIL